MADATPTTSTANQDKLRSYLAGVDHETLGQVVFDWQYVPPPLNQTRDYLKDSARDQSTLGQLGRGLATTLATAFHGTSEHLDQRSALITPAATNLGLVIDALKAAQDHLDTWDAKPLTQPPAKPNPNDPRYDTTNPDNVNADGTPKPGHDFNQADSSYQTASSAYASDNGQREQIAGQHVAAIDAAMVSATASMKAIHQQPDPTSSSGGGAAAGGASGGLPIGGTPSPITVPPLHGTPPPTGTTEPPVVVGPGHPHPPVGPSGPSGPGGPGGGANPTHGSGSGWGGPGSGSSWNGPDPTAGEPSTSGLPGGVGLGAAVLGGGLVAGAGGFAGLRALGGTLAEEGGLGMSARGAGAPSVLGKGGAGAVLEEEGAGARGGAAGSGARGAGGAGGRGRGKGKKRPEGEHGDLWDDGEDWIDDEGAAPGVLD